MVFGTGAALAATHAAAQDPISSYTRTACQVLMPTPGEGRMSEGCTPDHHPFDVMQADLDVFEEEWSITSYL
jgi:hypothetical protein